MWGIIDAEIVLGELLKHLLNLGKVN